LHAQPARRRRDHDDRGNLHGELRCTLRERSIEHGIARCVEMYREPGETGYAWKGVCAEHEVALPAALPRVRVAVAEIFR
jgi:hypothetical protein